MREIDPPRPEMRRLQLGNGRVEETSAGFRLVRPAEATRYEDAQLDDYGGRKRTTYPWRPGVSMRLHARFSHPTESLLGTAGFGFWNAPFGDPTTPWPMLPQVTWFFFGSAPNDFPVNTVDPNGPGRGFFANTIDATTWRALRLAPFAPPTLLVNRIPAFRRSVWPRIQSELGMSYRPLDDVNLAEWHRYGLEWTAAGCRFSIDDHLVFETGQSPRGPLGFVCWIDNQYLTLTPTGRFSAGIVPCDHDQWLEVEQIELKKRDYVN